MSDKQRFWDVLFNRPDDARLRRLEAKVDVILGQLGVAYEETAATILSDEVKTLAELPRKKFAAVKLHRRQTGAGLREAEAAVANYLRSRRKTKRTARV